MGQRGLVRRSNRFPLFNLDLPSLDIDRGCLPGLDRFALIRHDSKFSKASELRFHHGNSDWENKEDHHDKQHRAPGGPLGGSSPEHSQPEGCCK